MGASGSFSYPIGIVDGFHNRESKGDTPLPVILTTFEENAEWIDVGDGRLKMLDSSCTKGNSLLREYFSLNEMILFEESEDALFDSLKNSPAKEFFNALGRMAGYLAVDWEGFVDENSNSLPFDKAVLIKWLSSEPLIAQKIIENAKTPKPEQEAKKNRASKKKQKK